MGKVYCTLKELEGLQYEAKGFSYLPKRAIHNLLAGRHASKLRGRGLDFAESRLYVPGDDIRYIDWKVSARAPGVYTKTYTEERERPVWLFVDQTSSMFFGSKNYFKSVMAAHMAALAAWRVLSVGDKVGGVVITDDEMLEVKPYRSRKNVRAFLGRIEYANNLLKATKKYFDIEHKLSALQQLAGNITSDGLVVIFSDFRHFDEKLIKIILQMKRHNDVILAMIRDEMEDHLPNTELILSDGDEVLKFGGKKSELGKFEEHQQLEKERITEIAKKYGVPILNCDTEHSAAMQLRKFMGIATKGRRMSR